MQFPALGGWYSISRKASSRITTKCTTSDFSQGLPQECHDVCLKSANFEVCLAWAMPSMWGSVH